MPRRGPSVVTVAKAGINRRCAKGCQRNELYGVLTSSREVAVKVVPVSREVLAAMQQGFQGAGSVL
jgi:hypothetical protein